MLGLPHVMSARPTRKARRSRNEMRSEYDFSGDVRGKYAARYREGTSVVLLEPAAKKPKRKAKARSR